MTLSPVSGIPTDIDYSKQFKLAAEIMSHQLPIAKILLEPIAPFSKITSIFTLFLRKPTQHLHD